MASKYIYNLSETTTCDISSDIVIDDITGTRRISYQNFFKNNNLSSIKYDELSNNDNIVINHISNDDSTPMKLNLQSFKTGICEETTSKIINELSDRLYHVEFLDYPNSQSAVYVLGNNLPDLSCRTISIDNDCVCYFNYQTYYTILLNDKQLDRNLIVSKFTDLSTHFIVKLYLKRNDILKVSSSKTQAQTHELSIDCIPIRTNSYISREYQYQTIPSTTQTFTLGMTSDDYTHTFTSSVTIFDPIYDISVVNMTYSVRYYEVPGFKSSNYGATIYSRLTSNFTYNNDYKLSLDYLSCNINGNLYYYYTKPSDFNDRTLLDADPYVYNKSYLIDIEVDDQTLTAQFNKVLTTQIDTIYDSETKLSSNDMAIYSINTPMYFTMRVPSIKYKRK